VSPLLIFALGLSALRHIWRRDRQGKIWGRKSGIKAALMAFPMIITRYLIQAVTHVGWLRALPSWRPVLKSSTKRELTRWMKS
jgi:hypothetical protein